MYSKSIKTTINLYSNCLLIPQYNGVIFTNTIPLFKIPLINMPRSREYFHHNIETEKSERILKI